MTLTDVIALVLIFAVIGGAVAYIMKAKKSGKKCIGCPDGCSCQPKDAKDAKGGCSGCCGNCASHDDTQ